MEISFNSIIPVLRIFDVVKADEFYQGFLGFAVDWDHRFDPSAPLYRQISRGNLILHLSEHHGDGTPGALCSGDDGRRRGVSTRAQLKGLFLYEARPRSDAVGDD